MDLAVPETSVEMEESGPSRGVVEERLNNSDVPTQTHVIEHD